jgi:hypothetical protein
MLIPGETVHVYLTPGTGLTILYVTSTPVPTYVHMFLGPVTPAITGGGVMVTSIDALEVQPDAFVTVTVYVPPSVTIIDALVECEASFHS